MAEKVVMPQLGESIAEGTIVKWLKKPGDSVKKDEDICVISTDKVEAEIPAPADGVMLSIDVPEGETVDVGSVLAYVGAEGEESPGGGGGGGGDDAPKEEPKEEKAAPEPKPEPKPAAPAPASSSGSSGGSSGGGSSGGFVSPLVRRIAQDAGISDGELDQVPGTGNNGRVTKKDIQKYIAEGKAGSAPAASSSGSASSGSAPAASSRPAPAPAPSVAIPAGERELVKPASSMRKVIMENMVASKSTSAHVTTFFDIDFTAVDKVRREHKKRFKEEEGVGLTYTVFMAAAVAQVLKRHSYINAEIRGTDLAFKKDVHLGMAVAIESPEPGLMVPVIKNADQLNLRGLAHSINDLATRVRTRKIKPDELSGGTFTITNPGNYGAIIGTPIINQPQVAILGMGRIQKEAVVKEVDGTDVIAIRNMGVVSLSFDHRLIDGATADIFMADVKRTLEEWTTAP